jgi:hypothetical protein
MCGDLDEDGTRLDDELYGWLVATARVYGIAPATDAPPRPWTANSGERMGLLFRQAFTEAITDIAQAPAGSRAESIRGQAIVLARLAGLLAGHLPPESDVFRTLIDALMDGNREPEHLAAHHHDHDHHHGHDHDHHGHDHDH